MNALLAAYRYLSNNWEQIHASRICGCCNCLRTFAPDEVVGWVGLTMENMNDPAAVDKQTAMCPHCGAEAVLGDQSGLPINAAFLTSMNEAWFQRTMIRSKTPK